MMQEKNMIKGQKYILISGIVGIIGSIPNFGQLEGKPTIQILGFMITMFACAGLGYGAKQALEDLRENENSRR